MMRRATRLLFFSWIVLATTTSAEKPPCEPTRSAGPTAGTLRSSAGLDAARRSIFETLMTEAGPLYAIETDARDEGASFVAVHPHQALVTRFSSIGLAIADRPADEANWQATLIWQTVGRGVRARLVADAELDARGSRVELRRNGGLVEWYLHGPPGLEQGFTLSQRPDGPRGEPLTLELVVLGDLSPRSSGPDSISLTDPQGIPRLTYSSLVARDALGRPLPSCLAARGGSIFLRVDDEGARYPVVVDPLIQEAKLVGYHGHAGDLFGLSVDVEGDLAVIGAPDADGLATPAGGAVDVFLRQPDGTWDRDGRLVVSSAIENGFSVAIDGDRALIGDPEAVVSGKTTGKVYTFERAETGSWHYDGSLVGLDSDDGDAFGTSIDLDGAWALVGAPGESSLKPSGGAAYVFVRDAGGWSQLAKLQPAVSRLGAAFGTAVDLDGNRAIVGAPYDSGEGPGAGAATVFERGAILWTRSATLVPELGWPNINFGWAVGISGNLALVSTPGASFQPGAVVGFRWATGSWVREPAVYGIPAEDGDKFGYSVDVDGSRAFVGAPGANGWAGRVALLEHAPSGWRHVYTVQSPSPGADAFGWTVAFDGMVGVVGAPKADDLGVDSGAAFVFDLDPQIFSDGFESGNVSRWSSVAG